ncbi:MAG: hypothetical protein ACON4Z_09740, partial [Planctomycetota bacterium]
MTTEGLAVEVQHADRLCYAMQQSAVPWLHAVTLRNEGAEPLAELVVKIGLEGFSGRVECRVDALPAGASLQLDAPDLPLRADAFAGLLERTRALLQVTVTGRGGASAQRASAVDVLAYNEWPGLAVLPPLLAAFVTPNHPALGPLLRDAATQLQAATGDGALDGYQRGDPARVGAIVDAVHVAIAARGVRYVSPPPSFEEVGQKVRLPEQVVGERLGTCLDLCLLYAAVFEHVGLEPFLVLQRGHALVGCWIEPEARAGARVDSALELRKAVAAGVAVALEATVACVAPPQPPSRAA